MAYFKFVRIKQHIKNCGLEYRYTGDPGCNRCRLQKYATSIGDNAFHTTTEESGFVFSGSFTDSAHMTGRISVDSTNCALVERQVSAERIDSLTVVDSFAFTPTRPIGLACDGDHLWTVGKGADSQSQKAYRLDSSGRIVSEFPLESGTSPADSRFTGVAFDGTHLWFSDGEGNKILKYTTDGTRVSEIQFPGQSPQGLTFVGTYLWVADAEPVSGTSLPEGTYIYRIDRSGQEDQFTSHSGTRPSGLSWLANELIVSDTETHKIYISRVGQNATFDAPGPDPAGLAFDGTHLWLADTTESRIYKLRLGSTAP